MGNIDLKVPVNYSEMTENQISYVARLKLHGISEKDIWRRCFIKFSGIKPMAQLGKSYVFSKKGIKGFFTIKIDDMSFFVRKMNWLTSNYIGVKPLTILELKSCDELMRDTKFIQYIDAENHYEAFIYTGDENELVLLAATLYQEGSVYTKSATKIIAKKIRERKVELYVSLMWMLGIKQEFAKKWPSLFPANSAKNDDDNEFQSVVPDMERIIRDQLRMLTKGDVTKETQVLSSLTHSALDELNSQCLEYENLKNNKNHNSQLSYV